MYRTWQCPEIDCDYTVRVNQQDIEGVGIPICAYCGEEMELKTEDTTLYISIMNGKVTVVSAQNPELFKDMEVKVIDYDVHPGAKDEEYQRITFNNGNGSALARVYNEDVKDLDIFSFEKNVLPS